MDASQHFWREGDREYREALEVARDRAALVVADASSIPALVQALTDRGWNPIYDRPAPMNHSARYAYALKDLQAPLTGNIGVHRSGDSDVVVLLMVLAGAIAFDDLIAVPKSWTTDPEGNEIGRVYGPLDFADRFPSGDCRWLAVLRQEPTQLARRPGLSFLGGYDDLDYALYAWLDESGPEPILLLRHIGSPYAGTGVLADRDVRTEAVIALLCERLQLHPDDVVWQNDTA